MIQARIDKVTFRFDTLEQMFVMLLWNSWQAQSLFSSLGLHAIRTVHGVFRGKSSLTKPEGKKQNVLWCVEGSLRPYAPGALHPVHCTCIAHALHMHCTCIAHALHMHCTCTSRKLSRRSRSGSFERLSGDPIEGRRAHGSLVQGELN